MPTMQIKSEPTEYLTPLTPTQMKDVQDLIVYTEANRKPLRKPRIRKRDPNSTPRPVNCFLVYRREKQAQIAELCVGANHRVISKIVARWWKNIDPDTKALYVDAARQVKKEHAIKFPGYKYAPKRKHNSANQGTATAIINQPASPARFFFQNQEEINLPNPSTATVTKAISPFTCEATRQLYDLVYDPQSFPIHQNNGNSAPLLTQPLVDDSMAQYLDAQQWQIDNTSHPAFHQMLIQPQLTHNPTISTSAAAVTQATTNWLETIDPQTTMIQQPDTVHSLDLLDPSNPIDFNTLGYGMDNIYWPLDTPSFITPNNNTSNNNHMLDLICTPDLLAENDSPLSVSSPYAYSSSLSYGQSQFVHPLAAVKDVTSSSF